MDGPISYCWTGQSSKDNNIKSISEIGWQFHNVSPTKSFMMGGGGSSHFTIEKHAYQFQYIFLGKMCFVILIIR